MTDARTEILARINAALTPTATNPTPTAVGGVSAGQTGHGAAPTPPTAGVEVPRTYRAAGEHLAGSDEVLELLVDRLVDYKAHVVQVPADGVAAAVAAAVASGGEHTAARSVVVPPGLDPAWTAALADAGVEVRTDTREAPLSNAELDSAAAVVTAARVAIAETGTIVLDAEPDQGRRAITLVPDVHVCVVRADQVVQTVPEAVRLLAPEADRPQTWISGPSATSDIELDRVEGVHGPRTLHVVIVG